MIRWTGLAPGEFARVQVALHLPSQLQDILVTLLRDILQTRDQPPFNAYTKEVTSDFYERTGFIDTLCFSLEWYVYDVYIVNIRVSERFPELYPG